MEIYMNLSKIKKLKYEILDDVIFEIIILFKIIIYS
jgi:hypothetical protein